MTKLKGQGFDKITDGIRSRLLPGNEIVSDTPFQAMLWRVPCVAHIDVQCQQDRNQGLRLLSLTAGRYPEHLIGIRSGAWELPPAKEKEHGRNTDEICPASQPQILTALLWNDPHPIHEKARVLAVGDPLASLVTLVWEAQKETIEETFLEHFLHRYFVQMRALERTLAQRPGLQLVLVAARGDDRPTLRLAFLHTTQQLMRKLGEAALDVQIRWIEEEEQLEEEEQQVDKGTWLNDLLSGILSAHGPGFKQGDISPGIPSQTEIKDEMAEFVRHLPPAEEIDELSPWRRFRGCLAWDPDLLPQGSAVALEPAPVTRGVQPPSLLLSARLKARRFMASALWVDLAPVTLIASENAAGKTTLVEGLSQLYTGRARVRTHLPEGASNFWPDTTSGPINEPPEIFVLRLTQAPDQAPDSQAVLPLFADDAELDRGRIGEISLLSLFPVLEMDGKDALLSLLGDVDESVDKLQDAARQLRANSPGSTSTTAGSEDLILEENHRRLWERYLQSDDAPELDQLKEAFTSPTPQPSGKSATEGTTAEQTSPEVKVKLADLASVLPLMFSWLVQTGGSATNWDELHPLWEHSSTRTILGSRAADRLEELAYRLEGRLRTYCEALARNVVSVDALRRTAQAVEQYLDIGLELPQDGTRANTARQVRKGFAARLTCWLAANHDQFPILIVDEPVLGQDTAAAAAALGRFLRLRRIHEGLRWARSLQSGAIAVPSSILGVAVDGWDGSPSRTSSLDPIVPAAEYASWEFPLPPQVILASHLSATLVAAADSEGVVLDLEMQKQLRALIFHSWIAPIRDMLKTLTVDFDRVIKHRLPGDWKPLTAAALVRVWNMPSGANTVWGILLKDGGSWWKNLRKALTTLRLGGLHYLVVAAAVKTWTITPKDEADWTAEFEKISPADLLSIARNLVLWLIATDLLPAILADAQAGFEVSGVALRQLPAAGGEAFEVGPSRLRRVGAWLETLPPIPPVPPSAPVPKGATTAGQMDVATVDSVQPAVVTPAEPLSVEPAVGTPAEVAAVPSAESAVVASAESAVVASVDMVAPAKSAVLALAESTESVEPPSAPLQAEHSEALLPTSFAVGVWRVRLVNEGGALPTALNTAIEEAFRAAGMLPYHGEPHHVRLQAPARPTIAQTAELTWRCSWVLLLRVAGQDDETLTYEHTRGGTKDAVDQWVQDSFIPILVRWLQTRSDLTRKLELLRLRRLASGSEAGGDSVAVGIWTYIPDEVANPEVAYTFGSLVQDRETEAALQARWDARITQGLLLLRQTLGGSSRKQVRFYPKCHPAVAVRAGAIFSHRTGFSLEAIQNGSAWDMDLHKARVRPGLRIDSLPVPGTLPRSDEMHVLLSFTQDVQAGYEAWQTRYMTTEESPRIILHIQPPGGPGRDSVPRDVVTDLGESIVEILIRRKKTGDRLRFFIAAPNALSLALGRSLNALGDVSLMDWIKEEMRYVETFKLIC
jgi:hypothetical protein